MEIRLIRFSRKSQMVHFVRNDDPSSTPEYSKKGDIFDALNAAEELNVPWEIDD